MTPFWDTEMDWFEFGFDFETDEPSVIEHRICRANGVIYCNRHWGWKKEAA